MQDLWKSLLERRQPAKAPDHLPLATLPCLPSQCNRCVGAPWSGGPWSGPSLQNTARQIPGQVDGSQVVSCAISYVTFKTRFTFKEHTESGAKLLATGPVGVMGRFVVEFMLLLDGSSVEDEDTFPASTVT